MAFIVVVANLTVNTFIPIDLNFVNFIISFILIFFLFCFSDKLKIIINKIMIIVL